MSRLSILIPAALLATSGFAHAESSTEPGSLREAIQQSSGGSPKATGSGASGSGPTTDGNRNLDSSVRGNASDASTSDRDTSRRWSGVGSTGGATGTGTSSGTTDDPPTSGGNQQGSSASGAPAQGSEDLKTPGGSR